MKAEKKEAKMEFKTPEDRKLINATAAFSSSAVHECIESILEKEGYSFEKKGGGWDEIYEIKHEDDNGRVEFHLHNLYLEIATVDRDIRPLEWDERLLDMPFFRKKMADTIYSKIRPLLTVLSSNDPKEIDEKLIELSKDPKFVDTRIRTWQKKIKKGGGENKDEAK